MDAAIEGTPEAEQAYQQAFREAVSDGKPAVFRGNNSVTLEMERGWGRLKVALSESNCPNPDQLTVFDLYSWLDSLEQKYEAQKRTFSHAPKRR